VDLIPPSSLHACMTSCLHSPPFRLRRCVEE